MAKNVLKIETQLADMKDLLIWWRIKVLGRLKNTRGIGNKSIFVDFMILTSPRYD